MKEAFVFAAISIEVASGLICLLMAFKSMFSDRYLPFHEEAADRSWETIDQKLRLVILTILKISGLGFLVTGLLMTVFPIVSYFTMDVFSASAVPTVAAVYSFGLFLFNYRLYKKTNAATPWKASLIIAVLILISLALLIIARF